MRPPPNLQGQYAGFVSRLLAYLSDRAIIATVIFISFYVADLLFRTVGIDIRSCPPLRSDPNLSSIICNVSVFSLLAYTILFTPLYELIFWTLAGQTPGKALLGVRIVRLDGETMTFRRSFRRVIAYYFSTLVFGLGFLWILVDNRRQAWHDKFAQTCVIYAWEAEQNQRLIDRISQRLNPSRRRSQELQQKAATMETKLQTQAHEVTQASRSTVAGALGDVSKKADTYAEWLMSNSAGTEKEAVIGGADRGDQEGAGTVMSSPSGQISEAEPE